jgi:hypothetical protein
MAVLVLKGAAQVGEQDGEEGDASAAVFAGGAFPELP